MPQPSTPEWAEVGVLKDASTNMEVIRSSTWKKKNTLQALRINKEIKGTVA
jgi:hypothetical protein